MHIRHIQNRFSFTLAALLSLPLAATGCDGGDAAPTPHDPRTAEQVEVDRFSEAAGHLQVRTAENGLPGPNQPIDFDKEPFITRGLGPNGESVRYYNFDVQPLAPAPIYALFREGESTPVEGQLNVVGVIPGDPGYNDFWLVHKVIVPEDYVANTVASVDEILDAGYEIEPTTDLVNCPIVPLGSTANLRLGNENAGLVQGWYEGRIVHYFHFGEASLAPANGIVPAAAIYVTFNKNPDDADPSSGPASGFVTEGDTDQTHNVLTALPGQAGYSPLWSVWVYDNAAFDSVTNLASVKDAPDVQVLAEDVALVNCPVVEIEGN
jgi:hypothetical protein